VRERYIVLDEEPVAVGAAISHRPASVQAVGRPRQWLFEFIAEQNAERRRLVVTMGVKGRPCAQRCYPSLPTLTAASSHRQRNLSRSGLGHFNLAHPLAQATARVV